MKKLLGTPIFILVLFTALLAQNNQPASCPKISVTGPASVPQPGDAVTFTAKVEEIDSTKITYAWTITNGEILAGQGTPALTVKVPERIQSLTATVEIKGLPEGCSDTVSEAIPCDLRAPEAEKIAAFSGFVSKVEKAGIDKIIEAVQDSPTARLYIFIGHSKKTLKTTLRKEREIYTLLAKEKGIDADRINIIRVSSEMDLTQIWIVPSGATPPQIEN